MDHTVGDDAAGDAAAAGLEHLAHFSVAVHDLLVARLEHAREHLLDVFDQRVDDVVLTDRHPVELGDAARLVLGLDVEGDDHRL